MVSLITQFLVDLQLHIATLFENCFRHIIAKLLGVKS